MKNYGEVMFCIDDLLSYEQKAGLAMEKFCKLEFLDDSKSSYATKVRPALNYALMQHKDVNYHIKQLQTWSYSKAPDVNQYGNAKQFLWEKNLSKIFGYSIIGSAAFGLVGCTLEYIPVIISGMVMSALSFILSKTYNSREDDMRFAEDLKKYRSDKRNYNIESGFYAQDMNRLVKSLDSYIPAVQNLIDKLDLQYEKDDLPNDNFNDIINSYIGLKLFRKDIWEVADVIREQKMHQAKNKNTIAKAVLTKVNLPKEPQFTS